MDAHLVLQSSARLEPRKAQVSHTGCRPSLHFFPSLWILPPRFFPELPPRFAQAFSVPQPRLPPCAVGGWMPVVQFMSNAIVTHEVPVSKFIPRSLLALICVSLQYTWKAARNSGAHLCPFLTVDLHQFSIRFCFVSPSRIRQDFLVLLGKDLVNCGAVGPSS